MLNELSIDSLITAKNRSRVRKVIQSSKNIVVLLSTNNRAGNYIQLRDEFNSLTGKSGEFEGVERKPLSFMYGDKFHPLKSTIERQRIIIWQ
jgi:hypothetical protein